MIARRRSPLIVLCLMAMLGSSACGTEPARPGAGSAAPLAADAPEPIDPVASLAEAISSCTPQERDAYFSNPLLDIEHPGSAISSPNAVEIEGGSLARLNPGERLEQVDDDPSLDYYTINVADLASSAVVGVVPATFKIFADRFDRLQPIADGKTIFLSVAGDDPWARGVAVVVNPATAEIALEGGCYAVAVTEVVADFRAAVPEYEDVDPVVLVRELFDRDSAASAALIEHALGPPPPAWIDQSPDTRILDPADMPQELLDPLVATWLAFDIQPEWLAYAPGTLCARIPDLGWSQCVDLKEGEAYFNVLTMPGEALELWALDERAFTGDPRALLATISAAALDSAIDGELALEWNPATSELLPVVAP